jgi:hypothetical protein
LFVNDLLSQGGSDAFSAAARRHRSATVAGGDAGRQRRARAPQQEDGIPADPPTVDEIVAVTRRTAIPIGTGSGSVL